MLTKAVLWDSIVCVNYASVTDFPFFDCLLLLVFELLRLPVANDRNAGRPVLTDAPPLNSRACERSEHPRTVAGDGRDRP
jgi:hypothetical protein